VASIARSDLQSATHPSSWPDRLLLIGRFALGAAFLYAAWSKMPWNEPWQLFAMKIAAYQLPLPVWIINIAARGLPWFEALLGLLLLIGWPLRIASTAASALLLGFFSLMVYGYAHGLAIDCGCGLPGGDTLGPKSLARDGALLAVSLAITMGVFLRARRRKRAAPTL
jgi:uncharacterized membrane protein YphA (DoxX/SURF4 family)